MGRSIRTWLLCGALLAAPAVAQRAQPGGAELAPLEALLRTTLAPTAAVVVHGAGSIELHYPVRLAFAADRAELLPAGTAMLDALAHALRDFRHTQIVVAVYTDAIGSSEFNQQQAQTRAGVVVAYLQIRGVAAARLIARGVGEAAQLPAPDTPEGRDLNRRLELTITPLS